MKIYYEESDLVSFGKYLLSKDRLERIMTTDTGNSHELLERLGEVYHADLENWKEEQKKVIVAS